MDGQRRIRGIKGDLVVLTVTPDPLDAALGLPPIPLLHVSVTDACGDSCTTDGKGHNANVVGVLTIAGARRLHAALGALLAETAAPITEQDVKDALAAGAAESKAARRTQKRSPRR